MSMVLQNIFWVNLSVSDILIGLNVHCTRESDEEGIGSIIRDGQNGSKVKETHSVLSADLELACSCRRAVREVVLKKFSWRSHQTYDTIVYDIYVATVLDYKQTLDH